VAPMALKMALQMAARLQRTCVLKACACRRARPGALMPVHVSRQARPALPWRHVGAGACRLPHVAVPGTLGRRPMVQRRAPVAHTCCTCCSRHIFLTCIFTSCHFECMQDGAFDLSAPPPFTLQDLRNAIPAHCWVRGAHSPHSPPATHVTACLPVRRVRNNQGLRSTWASRLDMWVGSRWESLSWVSPGVRRPPEVGCAWLAMCR
jgi:hypothetical protein